MSREKSTVRKNIFSSTIPGAVAALRRRLGWSQEGLARHLDISTRQLQKWEKGDQVPSGDLVLTMLAMCPDRESLEAFGVVVPEGHKAQVQKPEDVEAEMGKGPSEMSDPELREWHKNIQDVVRYLGEQKRAGNKVAAEMLRSMAQSVVRAAGLATEPGMSKARRTKMVEEEIRRIEKLW